MQLPLTSIKDAWGVVTLDDRSDTSIVNNRRINKTKPRLMESSGGGSGGSMHPNSIQQPVQNRMDIAVFDKWVIDKMATSPPQDRTLLVSQLLRSHLSAPPTPLKYTQPMSPFEHSGGERVEYFTPTGNRPDDPNEQLLGILTLTLFFILFDKLLSIWNKS